MPLNFFEIFVLYKKYVLYKPNILPLLEKSTSYVDSLNYLKD